MIFLRWKGSLLLWDCNIFWKDGKRISHQYDHHLSKVDCCVLFVSFYFPSVEGFLCHWGLTLNDCSLSSCSYFTIFKKCLCGYITVYVWGPIGSLLTFVLLIEPVILFCGLFTSTDGFVRSMICIVIDCNVWKIQKIKIIMWQYHSMHTYNLAASLVIEFLIKPKFDKMNLTLWPTFITWDSKESWELIRRPR